MGGFVWNFGSLCFVWLLRDEWFPCFFKMFSWENENGEAENLKCSFSVKLNLFFPKHYLFLEIDVEKLSVFQLLKTVPTSSFSSLLFSMGFLGRPCRALVEFMRLCWFAFVDISIFQVFGNSLAFKSSFSDCFSEFLWKSTCCQLQKVRISIFIWVL